MSDYGLMARLGEPICGMVVTDEQALDIVRDHVLHSIRKAGESLVDGSERVLYKDHPRDGRVVSYYAKGEKK